MKTFDAIEMSMETGEPTGRVLTFMAESVAEAASMCLYTAKLSDGMAFQGYFPENVYSPNKKIGWYIKLDNLFQS